MTTQNDNVLILKAISQAYGRQQVVKNLSLSLKKGEIGCLLGASGCGKTTVLRTIAGFEHLLGGEIILGNETISSAGAGKAPAKRNIGMVFQDYALFPHLSISDNIAFGLRGLSKRERQEKTLDALELVGLKNEGGKYPHEISGGQQQRVALARALAPEPQVLLMDEPFSNLDLCLRERLSLEVRDILKQYGTTTLFVTHNQHEAFAVADKIGVMHNGEILQWGNAHQLYQQPHCPRIAEFVGEGTLIDAVVCADNRLETCLGPLAVSPNCCLGTQKAIKLLIRPEDVRYNEHSSIRARVIRRNFRGAETLYQLQLENGEQIQTLMPSYCNHQPGDTIGLSPEIREPVTFPCEH